MKTDMSITDPTDRQIDVLDFIIQFKQENGTSPTFREIGKEFGMTAKGAHEHVKALQQKGYVYIEQFKHRSIKVLRLPAAI